MAYRMMIQRLDFWDGIVVGVVIGVLIMTLVP